MDIFLLVLISRSRLPKLFPDKRGNWSSNFLLGMTHPNGIFISNSLLQFRRFSYTLLDLRDPMDWNPLCRSWARENNHFQYYFSSYCFCYSFCYILLFNMFCSICQSNVTPPLDHQRARVTPWCWWDNSWFWIAACCCRLWFDSVVRFQYNRACAGRKSPVLRWTETWRDLSLYAFRTASIDRPNLLCGRDTYKA